jgi:hypothetical protein
MKIKFVACGKLNRDTEKEFVAGNKPNAIMKTI